MKKVHLILLVPALMLAACSDGGRNSDTPSIGIVATKNDLPIVENEDLAPGLKGADADGNGIRDDIDRLIAEKYSSTSTIKKVAEQHAQALQRSMEATTREQAKAAGNEIFRAGDCAYKLLPHVTEEDFKFRERMSAEIESLTANTKERLLAYWNGEALSGGMVFRSNQDPTCD